MDLAWRLARRLGDGRFRSGVTLAGELGVSRATIWNAARQLRNLGLDVHSVRGRGYRLADPVDWLDVDRIRSGLDARTGLLVAAIEVHEQIESTNARLLSASAPPPGRGLACLAEFQTRGRGRRGRRWLSPPGAGVSLSLAWQFERPPGRFSTLGLIAGLAVRDALRGLGLDGIMIKWPNDLVVADSKLGGLLVELRAEGNGPSLAVVGVGVNYRLPPGTATDIEESGGLQPTDLVEVSVAGDPPDRNAVASAMLAGLAGRIEAFGRDGAGELAREWREADALAGRQVVVDLGDEQMTGRAVGIDEDGALRVEHEGGTMRVTAGDVSVRAER